MKPPFIQNNDCYFSSATVGLVVDAARTMRLNLPPLTKDTLLPTARPKQELSSTQFAPLFLHCMLALYQEHFNATCRDDRDLFLACIINGNTLEEVIKRGIAFTKHCGMRGWKLSLDSSGSEVTFSVDTNLKGSSHHEAMIDLFSIGGLYRLLSWLIGESLCASDISIAQRKLSDTTVLSDLFDCPSRFHGSVNTITFAKETLKKPMIRTYRELVDLMASLPVELMPLPQPSSLSAHIEMLFRKWLAGGTQIPSINELASQLCQSGSTLRRNLARENSSFQHLIDKCRRQRAVELLGGTALTIDEISYCLGYSAPSGFTRAFKDWTGHTPSSYRHFMKSNPAGEQPDVCGLGVAP